MGKFYGKVGYVETTETAPGVFTDVLLREQNYFGNTVYTRTAWNPSENLNDNLKVTDQISILADQFAYENFSKIKYVEYMGVKWKITAIDTSKRPRMVLTLGGEYNGEQA